MAQSSKPRKRRDRPLKVRAVFAKPSADGDERWLKALKILLATEPEETKHGGKNE
jgi:hypothetical protein